MIKRTMTWLALAGGAAFLGLVFCSPVTADDKKDDKMTEVTFDLPKPVFAGTPKNIPPGTTVQKPTGKPRPPLTAPEGTTNLALN